MNFISHRKPSNHYNRTKSVFKYCSNLLYCKVVSFAQSCSLTSKVVDLLKVVKSFSLLAYLDFTLLLNTNSWKWVVQMRCQEVGSCLYYFFFSKNPNRFKIINLTPPNNRFPVFCFVLCWMHVCTFQVARPLYMNKAGCQREGKEHIFPTTLHIFKDIIKWPWKEFSVDQHYLFFRDLYPSTCNRQILVNHLVQ